MYFHGIGSKKSNSGIQKNQFLRNLFFKSEICNTTFCFWNPGKWFIGVELSNIMPLNCMFFPHPTLVPGTLMSFSGP